MNHNLTITTDTACPPGWRLFDDKCVLIETETPAEFNDISCPAGGLFFEDQSLTFWLTVSKSK